jgi:DNA-binding protein HU-beta
VNRRSIIQELARRTGMSRADARRVFDALFDAGEGIIAAALRAGDAVSLGAFGSLAARERAARTGRNPRTAAEIEIPASVAAAFRPGARLKETLTHGSGQGGREYHGGTDDDGGEIDVVPIGQTGKGPGPSAAGMPAPAEGGRAEAGFPGDAVTRGWSPADGEAMDVHGSGGGGRD